MRRPEPAHPTEVIDVGLQSERTYLAWQRTALAFAGVGALLLYTGLSRGPALAIPGGLGCSLALSCSLGRDRAID